MVSQQVFCNSPWYELHIYWDGSYNFCCAASHAVYDSTESKKYCVQNMSIRDWHNSEPMKLARQAMFRAELNSFCSRCMNEERFGATSRRHRSNQKSVIFTRTAFDTSYQQSPGYPAFEHARLHDGDYDGMPIDLHIDLGNHCNLACKMCDPRTSSKIAQQYKRWGIRSAEQYINTDWTRDESTWQRILRELVGIANLRNVHFMGGETLITQRFEDFVDYMADHQRFDLNFSFVSNGTIFDQRLMDKLSRFGRIGVEVSIESLDSTNRYQRQGTDQDVIMSNIERYMTWCDGDRTTLTLRPAVSALTIGSLPSLLAYAYHNRLTVKALLVHDPQYLDARVLPDDVRSMYLARYDDLIASLQVGDADLDVDYNESNPHEFGRMIANQIKLCRSVLSAKALPDVERLRGEMVTWCRRWDDVYGYDARSIYPEFQSMLDLYGY